MKTVSFGRNVQGTKRPSVWGESSRERNVQAVGETSWGKRRGGETSSCRLRLWTLEERRNQEDLIEVFKMYKGKSKSKSKLMRNHNHFNNSDNTKMSSYDVFTDTESHTPHVVMDHINTAINVHSRDVRTQTFWCPRPSALVFAYPFHLARNV